MKIVCDFLNMDGSVISTNVLVKSAFDAREKAKLIANKTNKAVRYQVFESTQRTTLHGVITSRRALVDTIIHPEKE